MRRSITISEPGRDWEVEVAGSEEFVLEMAERLGMYVKRLPRHGGREAAPAERTWRPEAEVEAPAASAEPAVEPGPEPPTSMDAELAPEQIDADEDLSAEGFYKSFLGSRDPAGLSSEDLVVLFGFYLQTHMGKESWSALDITTCFTMAGLPQPRNMIGMLSTLARQKGSITPESTGEYRLSDRSEHMIKLAMGM